MMLDENGLLGVVTGDQTRAACFLLGGLCPPRGPGWGALFLCMGSASWRLWLGLWVADAGNPSGH